MVKGKKYPYYVTNGSGKAQITHCGPTIKLEFEKKALEFEDNDIKKLKKMIEKRLRKIGQKSPNIERRAE